MAGPISSAATAIETTRTNPAAPTRRLSEAEQARVRQLEESDRRVRAHERAHVGAGQGIVSGGASFTYTRGPDGRSYAVGGEVPIDISPGRTPAETLRKAEAIVRAALAPADPSAQDRRVAARAAAMAAEARVELQAGNDSGRAAAGTALYRQVQADDGGVAATGIDAFA